MIQFNLLPDVKLNYIRTKQVKRKLTVIAVAVASVAIFVMVILFIMVDFIQTKHLDDLGKDISKFSKQLEDTPDITKVLTVQNQLNSLTGLHDQKPSANRLDGYIKQITPAKASISQLDVSFVEGTMIITGKADKLGTVNQFVDTLKFTTYDDSGQTGKAFKEVVLTSFSLETNEADYEIGLKFEPVIFDATKTIKLVVPNIVTTRSTIEKPEALFQPTTKGTQ